MRCSGRHVATETPARKWLAPIRRIAGPACAVMLLACWNQDGVRLSLSCMFLDREDVPVVTVYVDPTRATEPGGLTVVSSPMRRSPRRSEGNTDARWWTISASLVSRGRAIHTCSVEGNGGGRGGALGMNPPKTELYEPHLEVLSNGPIRVTIVAGSTEVASRILDVRTRQEVVLRWPDQGDAGQPR